MGRSIRRLVPDADMPWEWLEGMLRRAVWDAREVNRVRRGPWPAGGLSPAEPQTC